MGVLGPVPFGFRSLVVASLLAIASNATASPPTIPTDAQTSRSAPVELLEQVAQDPIWLALVHQARHSIRGATREAFRDAGFFFDPDGAVFSHFPG